MKKCKKCNIEKPETEYHKSHTRKDGVIVYRAKCKDCVCKNVREYKKQNKEKVAAGNKKWHAANPGYRKTEEFKEKERIRCKKYYSENRDKVNKYCSEYQRERKQNDPLYKFKSFVRHNISTSFSRKGLRKKYKSEELLGCTLIAFKKYIESKFEEGMTIENHGEWHLDHIIPLETATTEDEVIELCHYSNYQPLWADDNLRKGCKLDWLK